MIKTKSVYRPKDIIDGKRILISRLHPRGIKKLNMIKWLKELSPSIELIHNYKNKKITWRKFLSLYTSEISTNSQSLELVKQLRKQSKIDNITLLCFEPNREPCHRHVLREIIAKPSFFTKPFVPQFIDD